MAIVQTIDNAYQLEQAFEAAGRGNNFSYEGLKVLYNYLDNLSDETGKNIELDVVGLCCEYAESTVAELIDSYNIDVSDANGDEEEIKEIVHNHINEMTILCGETAEGFVYASF